MFSFFAKNMALSSLMKYDLAVAVNEKMVLIVSYICKTISLCSKNRLFLFILTSSLSYLHVRMERPRFRAIYFAELKRANLEMLLKIRHWYFICTHLGKLESLENVWKKIVNNEERSQMQAIHKKRYLKGVSQFPYIRPLKINTETYTVTLLVRFVNAVFCFNSVLPQGKYR